MMQHILASLNDQGRAGIVLDTGVVSRGSGSKSSNKERYIRSKFVDDELFRAMLEEMMTGRLSLLPLVEKDD